jgi:hypothetical protein
MKPALRHKDILTSSETPLQANIEYVRGSWHVYTGFRDRMPLPAGFRPRFKTYATREEAYEAAKAWVNRTDWKTL